MILKRLSLIVFILLLGLQEQSLAQLTPPTDRIAPELSLSASSFSATGNGVIPAMNACGEQVPPIFRSPIPEFSKQRPRMAAEISSLAPLGLYHRLKHPPANNDALPIYLSVCLLLI